MLIQVSLNKYMQDKIQVIDKDPIWKKNKYMQVSRERARHWRKNYLLLFSLIYVYNIQVIVAFSL